MEIKTAAKILIKSEAYAKLNLWVDMAKGEISFLGIISQKGNKFVIEEIYLPKQICTSGTTDIDADDMASLLFHLHKEGKNVNNLRAWIHSHADMDVFWSSTDEKTSLNTFNDVDFFISVVVNKQRKMLGRIDIHKPMHVTLDNIPVEIDISDYGYKELCEKIFEENVSEECAIGRNVLNLDNMDMLIPANDESSTLCMFDDDLKYFLEFSEKELLEFINEGELTIEEFNYIKSYKELNQVPSNLGWFKD